MIGMGDLHVVEVGSASGVTTHWKLDDPIEVIIDTEAVPLLLARYAVSRSYLRTRSNPVQTPKVSGPFVDPGINLGPGAHYTLRRLRSGFLYVFSEKDQGWRIFRITDTEGLKFVEGYHLPAALGNGKPAQGVSAADPSKFKTPNETDRLQHPRWDGVLFVPSHTPVWITFSDVKWTQKVLDEHAKEEVRKKHMRRFDPDAWKGHPHTAPLIEIDKRVAEAAPRIPKDAFEFSGDACQTCNPKDFTADDPVVQFKKLGAILALDDPAGIAMDLARLMTTQFKEWTQQDDPDYKARQSPDPSAPETSLQRKIQWTMLSASGIEQLKAVAANRAEARAYTSLRAHLCMDQMDMDEFLSDIVPRLNPQITGPVRKRAQEDRDNAWKKYEEGDKQAKPIDPKKAEAEAYMPLRAMLSMDQMGMDEFLSTIVPRLNPQVTAPYKKRALEARLKASGSSLYYDAKSYNAWKTALDNRLKTFSDTIIQPMAEAHVAWCEHTKFRDYFNHVFDFEANDAGMGVAFTQTVALCYAGVQDKAPCWNHIEKWLKDDLKKPEDNLIVMALILGHKETLSMVQQGAQSRVDPRQLPWDKMVKALAKLTSSTEKGVAAAKKLAAQRGTEIMKDAATAQVAAEFSGPLASVLKEAAESKVLPAGAIASGVASGKALIPVAIEGFISGHVKNLKFAIREAYPFLSPQEARGMAMQKIQGDWHEVYQQATPENRFVVHVDPEVAKDIPQKFYKGKDLPGGKKVCDWLMEHGLSEPERMGARPSTNSPIEEMEPLEVAKSAPKESRWTKPETNIGMTCTVIGAALAFVGWWQLNQEAKSKEGAAKITANNKLNFQICAATGATMETLGKAMTRVMESTAANGAIARKAIAVLKIGGTVLGAVAGFAAAYYEIKKTSDDSRLNNQGLLVAHFVSGVVGGVGAGLALVALLPYFSSSTMIPIVGWVLAAAGLIMIVVIEGLTDRIGDWLKQCSWGALGSDVRYPTFDAELSALKGAATT